MTIACGVGSGAAGARADTIETFAATGEFQSGSMLSGTLAIDTTIGSVTAVDLSISVPESITLTSLADEGTAYGAGTTFLVAGIAGGFVGLILPSPLIGYEGTPIASLSDPVNGETTAIGLYGSSNPPDELEYGSLTEVPEPSTVATFTTGVCLLGATCAVRRRRRG
jgi:hypothetical protein